MGIGGLPVYARWLIERGQPEGFDNAEWLTPSLTWTRDAKAALHFQLKADADPVIRRKSLKARAVLHEFSGPLPPEAFPHVAAVQTASVTYRDGKLTVRRIPTGDGSQ